ncbi:MAG TPA: BTAD domain-containing putative transcriptional regulator [Iamia sp.]|nr:BTAD domain-containing putative transcriptional regulator [Iamia sp.]
MTEPVRYRVLGPLEVVGVDGEPLDLRARKPRTLLCALLVSPGHTVSLDRIVEVLWGEEPPAAATATLQAYVSQLRRLLEPERGPRQAPTRLVTRPPGYALVVEPGALDAEGLERLVAQGEEAMAEGRPARAEDLFAAALALRRGTPFADVATEPFALGAVARLDQLLALADERRIDALLAVGRFGAAVADLERRVAEDPHRERSWAQLVEALYRSDRQADALRAYQACRRTLAEDLGVEPGPALRDLERRILAHEDLDPAPVPPPRPVGLGGGSVPEGAGPAPDPGTGGGGLVGRRAEQGLIDRALAGADRGAGSIVVVEGESGIGKSRLAEEAVARAEAAGFATAWATCLDEVGAPPLWPWLDGLARLGGTAPPEPAAAPDADPEAVRFARVLAVLDALMATARTRPALLVVDDVQWADALSLRALSMLPGRLHGARLVVVATVRRPDVHDRPAVHDLLADLRRSRLVHRVHLDGLAPDDVAALAEEVSGAPVPAALAATLAARTGGNPFFVSELVRLLVSERALATGAAPDRVPDSVREVVERRIGRLPDDTRTLLRLASISPGAIEAEVLERATGLPAERVTALLDVAVASGLLVEAEDRFGWRFAHALVQDAVRATLGRAQRMRLHATLGDAVEALHGADPHRHLDELAHHRVEAAPLGRVDDAVRWSTAAAAAARAAGRYDLAVRHRQAARRLLEGSPAEAARHWDLTLQMAQDQRAAGDTHAFGVTLTEAIATARALHDEHRMALAAAELGWVNLWNTRPYGNIDRAVCAEIERLADNEDDPALAARLRGAVAVELYYGGDRAHGETLARRAVAAARDLGDPALLGRTLNNLVLAAWVPERDDERLAACEESLALAGSGLPAQTEVVARLHRAALRLRRGEVGLVEADLARSRGLVAEVAIPEISAQLTYAECGLAILRARWVDAEALAEDAYEQHLRTQLWGADWCRLLQLVAIRDAQGRLDEIAEWVVRTAEDPSLAPARATAVLAVARTGDHAEARRLAAGWDWRDEPVDWSWDHRLPDWAEVAALTGSPDVPALREVLAPRAGLQRVSGTIVCCRGSMHDVLARLAWAAGDEAGARAHHDAAVVANRAVDATWWTGRLARDLPAVAGG